MPKFFGKKIKFHFWVFFYSRKVSDIFEDLNESTFPIAAASLGQVYKLKLKHGNKETVAVKVQVITMGILISD